MTPKTVLLLSGHSLWLQLCAQALRSLPPEIEVVQVVLGEDPRCDPSAKWTTPPDVALLLPDDLDRSRTAIAVLRMAGCQARILALCSGFGCRGLADLLANGTSGVGPLKRPFKNSLNIGLAALAVTLLGVIAVAAGAAANSKSDAASSSRSAGTGVEMQGAEAWPAFAMVFREAVYEWETGKVAGAETYRYLFNGSEDWQLELLESTRNPRTVGSRTTYKNATLTDAGMVDWQPVPVRTTKSDRPYMATWWLVPVAAERLGAKGSDYQRSADASDGKIRLYKDETAPCSSVSDVWQARLCGDGKQSYTQRTEKVMDPEHGIPLEIIGKTEGKVSSIIKVVELTYK